MFTNLFLCVTKIAVGKLFFSQALVMDGIHSLSDLSTDLLALFGIKFSSAPADEEHPFGHGKYEYVTSLFIGTVIIVLGFNIIREVVTSIYTGTYDFVIPGIITIYVTILVIIVKYLLSSYMMKEGRKIKNEIIIASAQESRQDVISSFVVLIGIGTTILFNFTGISILKYGDIIAGFIIGLMIFKTGISTLIDSIQLILGKNDEEFSQELETEILEIEGVCGVPTIHCVNYGPYYQLQICIEVDENVTVREGHEIADRVKNKLLDMNSDYQILVHVDPYKEVK